MKVETITITNPVKPWTPCDDRGPVVYFDKDFNPIAGLMTVPYRAILKKRHGIGVELSAPYFKCAEQIVKQEIRTDHEADAICLAIYGIWAWKRPVDNSKSGG